MKFAIVTGSHRTESQSAKVANYLKHVLTGRSFEHEATIIDLGKNPLPMFDEAFMSGDDRWQPVWEPIQSTLQSADGIVAVAPEWHGMVPAALKNFFLMCKPTDVGHKAGLIVSVSAGVGGAYPIQELRISGYKNNRLCWIPEHLILRQVQEILNDPDQAQNESDIYLRGRIEHTLRLFTGYAEALGTVREKNLADFKTYANGM